MLPKAVSERDTLPIKPHKNTVKNETQICEANAPERDADTFNIWRPPMFSSLFNYIQNLLLRIVLETHLQNVVTVRENVHIKSFLASCQTLYEF